MLGIESLLSSQTYVSRLATRVQFTRKVPLAESLDQTGCYLPTYLSTYLPTCTLYNQEIVETTQRNATQRPSSSTTEFPPRHYFYRSIPIPIPTPLLDNLSSIADRYYYIFIENLRNYLAHIGRGEKKGAFLFKRNSLTSFFFFSVFSFLLFKKFFFSILKQRQETFCTLYEIRKKSVKKKQKTKTVLSLIARKE